MSGEQPRALLRPEAAAAWGALSAALSAAEEAGRSVPCQTGEVRNFDDDVEVRAAAAFACAGCPVLAACGTFADANREPTGVWGGVDRSPRRYQRGAVA